MLNIDKIEKLLKSALKKRGRVNQAVLISFLISGTINVYADVSLIKSENLTKEKNNFIVNIEKPDEKKISHNEFGKIQLESNEGLILNNSIRSNEDKSVILNRKLDPNSNFDANGDSAKLIIAEIKKNDINDYIKGQVEVFGNSADIIFADEEGLTVNGARIHNANNVSFIGGKITKGKEGEFFETLGNEEKKVGEIFEELNGDIKVEGEVTTNSGTNERKLAFVGKNVNVTGKISNDKTYNEDVYIIAGKDNQKEAYINLGSSSAVNGRNIFIKASSSKETPIKIENGALLKAKNDITIDAETGEISINVGKDKIEAGKDFNLKFEQDEKIKITGDENKIKVGEDLHIKIYKDSIIEAGKNKDKLERNIEALQKEWTTEVSKEFSERTKNGEDKSIIPLLNNINSKNFEVGKEVSFDFTSQDSNKNISFDARDKFREDEIERILKEKEKKAQFDKETSRFTEISNGDGKFNISLDPAKNTGAKLYKIDNDEKALLLDIAALNGSGISHNFYNKFSINTGETLLFNNNTEFVTRHSQALDKDIKRINRNLKGTEARLILNEVEGTNAEMTTLAGNMEVLGANKVDVIFVNENGISLNGAKAFNISNLVLSTGKLNREVENQYDFAREKGKITFEDTNKNLKEQNIVLNSKEIELKTNVEAKNLSIFLKEASGLNKDITAKEELRLNLDGDEDFTNKNKLSAENISLKANKIINEGKISGNDLVYISSRDSLINKNEINSNNSITLRAENKIENEGTIKQNKNKSSDYSKDANIYLVANEITNKKDIIAVGGILTNSNTLTNEKTGKLDTGRDITLGVKETLTNDGSITTKDDLRITAKNLTNKDEAGLYSARVELNIAEKLENKNKATIAAGQTEAIIKAKELVNDNSAIISFSKFNIEAETIKNINSATIRNEKEKDTSKLIAKTKIENKSSEIKTLGKLEIITPNLENIGEQSAVDSSEGEKTYIRKLKIKESPLKAWFNGYSLKFSVPNEKKYINVKPANIIAGDNLLLKHNNANARINIENKNAGILSGNNIKIDGDLKNITTTQDKTVKEILENIKISLDWDTSSLVNSNTIFSSGNDGNEISLYQALKDGTFNKYNGKYFSVLKNANIPELDKVLNLALGNDWKTKNTITAPDDLENKKVKYYNLQNSAIVSARGNIFLEFAKIENTDASSSSSYKGYRDKYDADSYYERVEGLENIINIDTNDLVKNNLVADNGLFRKENSKEYVYESNKYIQKEVEGYIGFDYLNSKLKKSIKKDIRLIGDNYYQFNLISNMLFSLDSDNVKVTKNQVEKLLNNAAKEGERLNLKLGKELTKEQISKLENDIVWYVETELDGEKILTPVVYLSPKTLAKIKNKKESFAQIKAGGSILTYRSSDIVNKNSSISSERNTLINAENLSSRGHKDLDTEITAGNNLVINTENNLEFENSDLVAGNDIDLDATNLEISSSDIISNSGDVTIKADNVNITDRIDTTSSSFAENKVGLSSYSFEEAKEKIDKSVGSNIKGENVNLFVDKNINIKGSNIDAKNNIDLVAENVNLDSSISHNVEELTSSSAGANGLTLNIETKAKYRKESEKVNKSNLKAGNAVFIESEKDITLKSSNIEANRGVILEAGNNINIEDRNVKTEQSLNTHSVTSLSINNIDQDVNESKSVGSNILTAGYLGIDGKNIDIKSSNIIAGAGEIKAKENIDFKASEEKYSEKVNKQSLGITTEASTGALGLGLRAGYDSSTGEKTAEAINDYDRRHKNRGKLSTLSSLANGEVGIKANISESETEISKSKNSKVLIGKDGLLIEAKENLDLGGTDIYSKGDISISAKDIKTSKNINKAKTSEKSADIYLKQSGSVSSSALDAINAFNDIATDAENNELNAGLATAKAIGAATNLIFNDTIGANSKQTIGIKLKSSQSSTEEESKNNIQSDKNISINANGGDLNLKNVDIKAKEKLILAADKNISIKGGEKRTSSKSFEINADQSLTQSAGYSAFFGANSQVGLSGNASLEHSTSNNKENIISNINAGNLVLKSGENTDIESSSINVSGDADIKVGKNLKIKSELDNIKNQKIKSGAGYNASIGVASNTLGVGNVGGHLEGGQIYEDGTTLGEQTGISAGGSLNVEVGENLELEGATLSSSTKKGKLNVGKDLILKDLHSDLKAGGAIVGASGGLTGELGFDVEVGDQKDKQENIKSIIGLENENINANRIKHNDKDINNSDINTNILASREVTKDNFTKGGTASLSFSVKDSKSIVEGIKNKITKNNKKANSDNEKIYEEIGGGEYSLVGKPKSGDTERIYDEIKGGEYSLLGKAKADEKVEVENPLYSSREELAKRSLPDTPNSKVKTDDGERIYDEIKNSEYSVVEKPKAKDSEKIYEEIGGGEYSLLGKPKSEDTERIYDEIKGGEYSLLGKAKSDEKVEVENSLYSSREELAKRSLPDTPNSKVKTDDGERIYDEIKNSEYSVVGKPKAKDSEKIYEEIGGGEYSLLGKPKSEDTERIYDEIKGGEYSLLGKAKADEKVEVENPLYSSREDLAKRALPDTPNSKVKTDDGEKIYEEIGGGEYSLVGKPKSEETERIYDEIKGGEYSLLGKAKADEKVEVENPLYSSREDLAKRSLPDTPNQKAKVEENKNNEENIYEEIKTKKDLANRKLPEIPEEFKGNKKAATEENIYESIAELPKEKVESLTNTSYVPKKLSDEEKKKLFDEAKKKHKDRDGAKEAEKKLKLIAENSKNIPKEHLLGAVEKLAYGLSPEDNQALREKSKAEGTRVVRPDTIEGFEGENLKNMAKVLRNVEFDESYVKLREKINDSITEKLDKNPEFHRLMKTKLSGNEEGIKALFDMVEKVKRETLKEIAGIDGKKAEIDINKDRGALSLAQGYYDKGVVHTNIVPLLSFLRTQKANNKEILNTIVHELTHHDQAEIVKNKDKNISEDAKNDAKLLALNQVYYIGSGATSYLDYKKQPLEREAFLSGDKLGEKLTKLVDKGYTGDKVEIKKIEHLGGTNKNLESQKDEKVSLGENSLIYGLKDGRKELIESANQADKNAKNAILADSYIGYLNLGFEFSRLSDFAKKVKNDEVSQKDVEDIANFIDQGTNANLSDSRSRINSANNEDNKRIITELLKNETVKNALIKMDDLNEKEKALLNEIKKNPDADIDYPKTSPRFTEEQNRVIEEYNKVKEGLNETRLDFFAEKTKLIAKETLEKGGQVYFALDGLATDSIKFDAEKTEINFDRLKEFFDPANPYYNSVTSRELRYLYENFKDNPNLKFTIKKQVIENPIKDLEISPKVENSTKEVKGEEDNKTEAIDQSQAFERRLLPKLNIKQKVKNLFGKKDKNKSKDKIKEDEDFEDIETVKREIQESKLKSKEIIYSDIKFNNSDEPIYENINPKAKRKNLEEETIYSTVKTNNSNIKDKKEIIYTDVKKETKEPIYAEVKKTKNKVNNVQNETIYSDVKIKPAAKGNTKNITNRNQNSEVIYSEVKTNSKEPIYSEIKFRNVNEKNNTESIYENINPSKKSKSNEEIIYSPVKTDKKEPIYTEINFNQANKTKPKVAPKPKKKINN